MRNALAVWGQMVGPTPRFSFDKVDAAATWSDQSQALPIASIKDLKQRAASLPDMRYYVFVQCPCGATNPYPTDAPSGSFVDWTCPACGDVHTADACRAAYSRGVENRIRELASRP